MDFKTEYRPTIIISGEDDNMGHIVNINMAASSILDYTNIELESKNVNYLMPSPY